MGGVNRGSRAMYGAGDGTVRLGRRWSVDDLIHEERRLSLRTDGHKCDLASHTPTS